MLTQHCSSPPRPEGRGFTEHIDEVVGELETDSNWRKASTEEFLESLTTGLSTTAKPNNYEVGVSADEIRKRFELVPTESLETAREMIVRSISTSIGDISKESTVIGKVLEEAYVLMMKKILDNPDSVSIGTLQELTKSLNDIRTTQVATVEGFFRPTSDKSGTTSDPIINIVFNNPVAQQSAKREAEALTANISNFSELAQLADVANIVAKDKPMEIIDVTPKKDEDEDE